MTEPLRPFVSKVIRLIVVTCLGGLLPSASLAQTIVWTDANAWKIQRKDVTGGPVSTIVQFPSSLSAYQIHYDPIAAKLYYLLSNGSAFQRVNLDGSNPENIPIPPNTGLFFTLNVESRKIYWGKFSASLYRSDLNGAEVELHVYPICCLSPLLAFGDELFLAGSRGVAKGIWRADANGSNEQLLHESGMPTGAAYDPVESKIYVAASNKIYRLNRDGTGYQVVVFLLDWQQGAGGPEYVVVDSRTRKLYWTDILEDGIQRSNLDGSNVEIFITPSDAGNPNLDIRGLTIVDSPSIPALSDCALMTAGILILCAGLVILKKRVRTDQQARNYSERTRNRMRKSSITLKIRDRGLGMTGFGLIAIPLLGMPAPSAEAQTFPDAVATFGSAGGNVEVWGCVDGTQAYSIKGGVCNIGDAPLFGDIGGEHVMWTSNLYRLHNNRFEQIGMSWVKHDDWISDEGPCTACGSGLFDCNGLNNNALDPGCYDTYVACVNGIQNQGGGLALGPRSQFNAWTGAWPVVPNPDPGRYCGEISGSSGVKACRLQVAKTDFANYSGAQYVLEQEVIHPDETSATRNNNVSYKPATIGACETSGCDVNQSPCSEFRSCTGCDNCVYALKVGTGDCSTHGDCNDGEPCTTDRCEANVCQHTCTYYPQRACPVNS